MGFGESLRKAIEQLRTSGADKETVKEVIKELQRALIAADVEIRLVFDLSKKIETEAFKELPEGINRREHIIKATYDSLAELLGGTEAKVPERPKKILLVGLFGFGKTTTCGKLAHYYQKRGMKVGIICADTYRPAAFEQLKQICEKIKVPLFGNPKEKNAGKVVGEALKQAKGFDLLICDSAGRNALDKELEKEIKEINSVFKPEEKWLVLGADIGQVAKKQAAAFHEAVGVNGVIITRMDGSAKGGGALAACNATKSPVYFIGMGEHVDDLQAFDSTRFLSRIMGYGDLQALLEKAKEAYEEEPMDLEQLISGEFTLQAFYEQLKAARKIGPLGKVLDMMGMKQQLPKEMADMGEEKLDSFKIIMDSMTMREKIDPEIINSSRIARIAKGSGKTQENVRELLKNFKRMKKAFRKLKGIDEEKIAKGGLDMQKLQQMFAKKKKKKYAW